MGNNDKPLMTDEELATALVELKLAGYIEFQGEDLVRPTTKGLIYGLKKLQSLQAKDRVAVMLFCWEDDQEED